MPTEVNFEYYALEIRQLGTAAPGEYLVSTVWRKDFEDSLHGSRDIAGQMKSI